MVTDKNLEQFEKWYYLFINKINHFEFLDNEQDKKEVVRLLTIPFEMQIGVYLAYYDSLDVFIEVKMFETHKDWIYQIWGRDIMSPLFKMAEMDIIKIPETRNEAYKEAFKKADEILNKQLNN